MEAVKVYVTAPNEGVCVGGRWSGWLMRKHPDGLWISVRKLAAVDPYESLPEWMAHPPYRYHKQGEQKMSDRVREVQADLDAPTPPAPGGEG